MGDVIESDDRDETSSLGTRCTDGGADASSAANASAVNMCQSDEKKVFGTR